MPELVIRQIPVLRDDYDLVARAKRVDERRAPCR
jgi:hypothetical protein